MVQRAWQRRLRHQLTSMEIWIEKLNGVVDILLIREFDELVYGVLCVYEADERQREK